MAVLGNKITRNSLTDYVLIKTGLEISPYEKSMLKERIKASIRTMTTNGELATSYEMTDKNRTRAVYKLINNGGE